MNEVLKYFLPRHARAYPQEFCLLPKFFGYFGELNLYKMVSRRSIIRPEAIFMLGFIAKQLNLVLMSDFLQYFFTQKQRYARDFPQKLHLLPKCLCDFDEISFYNKVSDRHSIIYYPIFKLGFRSKRI